MALDNAIIEPIAKGYNKLPSPVRTGTSNFTSNIGTLLSIPNNVLQGQFKTAGVNTGRFIINTTIDAKIVNQKIFFSEFILSH